jgi:predicted nucleotidyltransferase
MLTREIAIAKAIEFITSCRSHNIIFKNVILFGSVLSGEATANSDIDLLLVSDSFGYDKWENAKLIAPINKHFSSIDAHTFPTEYYLEGDPLINEIKRTGIEIKNEA